MIKDASKASWLLMGASGRVGHLLSTHWAQNPASHPILTHSRGTRHDFSWSPVDEGAAPLSRFVEEHERIDAIVAMIGATPSTSGEMSETVQLARSVIEAAKKANIKRVLLASSSAVYAPGEGLSESNNTAPTSLYGQVKMAMERAVTHENSSPNVCCLRIGNVAGADALLGRVNDVSIRHPMQLDQFPDGQGPFRSYIGPSQLARCVEALLEHPAPLPPVLNCAAAHPVAMVDLAQAANLSWAWQPAPKERYSTQRITLDCSRLSHLIGAGMLAASPEAMVTELRNLGALS